VLSQVAISAQKFHFGLNAAVTASQVDGDNLRGFNKIGYSAGLTGGYAFSPVSWMVVELQYTTFGSAHGNENSPIKLETDIRTINTLCAYSVRFGDAWDGVARFRAVAGPRFHAVQHAVLGNTNDRNQLKKTFFSLHLGCGMLLTENLLLDLGYQHVLGNILEADVPGIDRLRPFFLSLGLTCYLYR